jgi:gag-polypeptide of LTR copia-type
MGSEMTMNSKSSTLAVPKLHDDRSNWADYQPRICNVMGARRLWRHIEGTASMPVPYAISNGIQMLADGKTPAMEDQVEAKESKIIDFKKREYLVRHIILSTTSTQLETKIKGLTTTEDMWNVVKQDTTSKSTLYLLDAEDQLSSMKLADNDNPKTHLTELKNYFQLMLQRRDNLMKIGLTMSDMRFNIIDMSSLPESYRPLIQTITVAERANRLSGMQSNTMLADDLIAFIIEEAQHQVINNECTKNAESTLAAHCYDFDTKRVLTVK